MSKRTFGEDDKAGYTWRLDKDEIKALERAVEKSGARDRTEWFRVEVLGLKPRERKTREKKATKKAAKKPAAKRSTARKSKADIGPAEEAEEEAES